ncbi:phosphatase PAP2 family protein [Daejeonella sp. JGW-45]|uniref:phosphatase PAP2 family protein n=1 Tax=Daejeonella sp. JGW-45 TaxID=3034148 RepID=UPI0023EB03B5|nr:phosphatase PAP2 family protein [Daejeonella sp. JGW-45]
MITIGKKRALHIIILIVAGFLLLTAFITFFPSSWIDLELSEEVQEEHNPILDIIMKAISWFGQTWISIAMVVSTSATLLLLRFKREAFYCLLTLLMGLITYGIKISVNRIRPTENLVRVIEKAKYQSFPSGHVGFYIAFFGLMAFFVYYGKWFTRTFRIMAIGICLSLIFSIPFSRIYLGAHWFTDVLGGFMTGSIYLSILVASYLGKIQSDRKIQKQNR